MQEDPGQFVRHDIVDKVLLRDLPSLYGISDVQELNSLFTMIAYHSGMEFSYESMSKESGVKKETIRRYVQYLEAAFLIKVVTRTDDTAKRFQRQTTFKIYLTNPSLRCALFEPIKILDGNIGDMIETAIYSQWIPRKGHIAYANWKMGRSQGEVDWWASMMLCRSLIGRWKSNGRTGSLTDLLNFRPYSFYGEESSASGIGNFHQ